MSREFYSRGVESVDSLSRMPYASGPDFIDIDAHISPGESVPRKSIKPRRLTREILPLKRPRS